MKELSELGADEARALRGVLFDLDDTLLSHGLLTLPAYAALWSLRDAGLPLVAVTGRPSGWGEVLARQWPVAGCVTENGAVHVVREGPGVARRDGCTEAERRSRRVRLAQLVDAVRDAVPEARLTDDVGARLSDVTWDIGERVALPSDRVDAIAAVLVAAGARTTRSSVHIHATFDADDKATGSLRFLERELGVPPAQAAATFAFVGDSGNDAACFAAFATTFGVANVRASLAHLPTPPRYVSPGAMGQGFAEIAARLLLLRA